MTPTRTERLVVTFEGTLATNGSIVYIGGMDLANMLSACQPWLTELDHPSTRNYPKVSIRVEVSREEATSS